MRFRELLIENFTYLDTNMKGGLIRRGSKEQIKELQEWLNNNGFNAGVADGIYGRKTRNAVKQFQQKAKITVDGDAGKQTLTAMANWKKDTQKKSPMLTDTKISGKTSWNELIKNTPFQTKFLMMQQNFPGLDSKEFETMIERESSFNTRAFNKASKAAGLFQFVPRTARELGTTVSSILRMTADEQLGVYEKYMDKWIGSGNNASGKLAMLQAAPAYANDPDDTIIYQKGSKAWKLNPGWRGEDGDITVGSIKNY